MPTFRSTPSESLTGSVRRLIASGGPNVSQMQEIQADVAAAQTARNMSLAEKARAEVEAMRQAQRDRTDPNTIAAYAGHAAGVDEPTARRMSDHLRGVLEQPSQADIDDADMVGSEAKPFLTGAPVMADRARRIFQANMAAAYANRLATGHTNADQLTQAAGNVQKQRLIDDAAVAPGAEAGNKLVAAAYGHLRTPFSTNERGVTTNKETGEVDESSQLAQAARGLSAAHSGLYREQTQKTKADREREAKGTYDPARGIVIDTRNGTSREVLDASGNPVGPKGAPEKALPASAAQKLIENNQNARRAEQALALINGQDITNDAGEVIAKGDKQATGYKGYIPEAILQRTDKAGIDARAALGDLGSMIIHERSGAAVTASEYPRLRPFIPLVTDDPATVKKKLVKFVNEYRKVTDETADFYRESGYKVPSEMLRGSGAAKAPPAGNAAQLPTSNAKGWKLMRDAAGNRAYVSSDGTQFEEVP
jgi:hypothetical protein